MDKFTNFLITKRWVIFGLLLALCIPSFYYMKNLKIDNSLEIWFLKGDETLKLYNEFKKMYGNDEIVLALIRPKKDMFDAAHLERIYDTSNKLEESKYIRRVLSITKAEYLDGEGGTITIEDNLPATPGADFSSEKFKKRLFSNPMWRDLLLNKEKNAHVMIIEPIAVGNMHEIRTGFLNTIHDELKGLDYKLGGIGTVIDEINRISLKDSGIFTPMTYLVLIVALYFFFQSFAIVLATTITMIVSSILMMGIFGMAGIYFNMISVVIPTLVIILCLADVIHIFTYYNETEAANNKLAKSLKYILLPCLFTSITTAVGFMSLCSSPMAILKEFGVFSAIGIGVAYVVSVLACVIILHRKRDVKLVQKDHFHSLLEWVNSINRRFHKQVVVCGVILLCLSFWGIKNLVVDTYSINFLLDGNVVKKDFLEIEKDYGFYLPLEVRLKVKKYESIREPIVLKKIDNLQKELVKNDELERATSITDVVKQLNKVLMSNRDKDHVIPDNVKVIAQELLLYEMDENNEIGLVTDSKYQEARVTVRMPMVSSKNMKRIRDHVHAEINKKFSDAEVDVIFGGYIPLYIRMMEYVTESQISSFILAVVFILICIAILFRSFRFVLIGIIPNVFPILFTLGFMGLVGINLDIATVTIAAIAIGISVDDTIHFLFMYRKLRNEGKSVRDSCEGTILTIGKAIITTSVLLVLGYSVLVLANIKSIIFFGLLIAVTMIFALICDLLLLPALLILLDRKSD